MSEEFEDFEDSTEGDLDLTIYGDGEEVASEVAKQINDSIALGLLTQGEFHLALTGGTLGIAISERLVKHWNSNPDSFDGLHIWWSDERFVPADSSERNARALHGTVKNSKIVIHQALASDQVSDIATAVEQYEKELDEVDLDLIILGVGPDGHVASLFPGLWDANEDASVIAVTNSPKPPAIRLSFSMAMINSAQEVWIVASGESKGDAVVAIVEEDLTLPCAHVRGTAHTRLIADTEAFLAE